MTNHNYIVQGKELIIGESMLQFDFPIDCCVEIARMVIVLLQVPPKVKYDENVFGVSLSEKQIKWQIEKRNYKLQPFTKIPCEYNGLSVYGGRLRLNNWCD